MGPDNLNFLQDNYNYHQKLNLLEDGDNRG